MLPVGREVFRLLGEVGRLAGEPRIEDLVTRWLDAGYTADEIVERMVAHPKGGEQVRGYLKPEGVNLLSYWLPALLFLIALVVAAVFLLGAVRRGSGVPVGETPSSADGATSETNSDHWGDEIEKELKEMDD